MITNTICLCEQTLRKHAYSNTIRILPPKYENFQMKNSDIFYNVYPCKLQFYHIKVGLKGVKII